MWSFTDIADQGDIVSFEHNLAQLSSLSSRLWLVLLEDDLIGIFEYTVHVFVESNDSSFDSELSVVEQPDLHATFGLEELVDHEL